MNQNSRIKKYSEISTSLACLNPERLQKLLNNEKPLHKGIGGSSSLVELEGTPLFVKKLPLTGLEWHPQNFMSTANIFDLPLFYHYSIGSSRFGSAGFGSAGFGAWRDLASHIMTTNWVISGECLNFPMMYHWRILSTAPQDNLPEEFGDRENYMRYWGNSPAIRKRIEELNETRSSIVLFLEYIPHTLHDWLTAQLIKGKLVKGNPQAESAIAFTDQNLWNPVKWMNEKGLLHCDANFGNILTDGELIYFTDFGLATSSKFELTPNESDFLKQHHHYDQACLALSFISFLKKPESSPFIEGILKKYSPIAHIMNEFFQHLREKSILTPYPSHEIDCAFAKL